MTLLTVSGDLKILLLDPLGGEYQYLISGSVVDFQAAVYAILEDPTTSGFVGDTAVWCW